EVEEDGGRLHGGCLEHAPNLGGAPPVRLDDGGIPLPDSAHRAAGRAEGGRRRMQVLSTDTVAEPDRFALWRDLICATFVHLDCEPVASAPPHAFSGRIVSRAVGPIRLSEVATSPQHVVRSRAQIARANEDDVLVSLQVTEGCRITQ